MTGLLVPAPAPLPLAPAAATDWRTVLSAYLDTLDSPATRRAYGRAITDCLVFTSVSTLVDLDGAALARYRATLTTAPKQGRGRTPAGSPLAPASVALALAAVRSFLTWARAMGAHRLPDEVITLALRTPKGTTLRPYSVLAEPEIAAVLAAANTSRDKALLAVMLGAGLRAAEVCALDVADVREDGAGGTVLHVRAGKGRKDRLVPVQPDVARLVRRYLQESGRRLGEVGPLFRAHDRAAGKLARGRLSTRAVGYLVARLTAAAGVDAKAISPHSLRHTYALRALQHGGNVVAVSKLLGHASVSTTQRYVDHLALSELRAAVPALPGLTAAPHGSTP